jgi:lysyl endopeptidase
LILLPSVNKSVIGIKFSSMKKLLFALLLVAFGPFAAISQISQGGTPLSILQPGLAVNNVPFETMPQIDLERLVAEDLINDQYKDMPWRFGENFMVNFNPANSGVWDILPKGDRLWRLGISSPGAFTINLTFDKYKLPPGAKLFIYNIDHSEMIGAFTGFNNQDDGYFATTLVQGDAIVIEYYEPLSPLFTGELNLEMVTHSYRDPFKYAKAFGGSGSCNVNVACPQSAGMENQIRSVCMLVSGGNGFCSAALINNTAEDGKPYILSANHCYSNPGSVVFWFNWQSPTCSNPSSSPPYNSISGATQRASYSNSDVWLMELNQSIPSSYNVYYSGWNRTMDNYITGKIWGIHHPSGDIKKISWSNLGVSTTAYLQNSVPGSGTHWRITNWSDGTTTEGGSSGSPVYDPAGRIIGQLHGGYASCSSITSDWYGKFGVSWTGGGTNATRLSNWLDPINSGVITLEGYDPNIISAPPVANFSASTTNPGVGQTVQLIDMSSNAPSSWSWSFSPSTITYAGGTNASSKNPQVQFNDLGYYTVQLTATNSFGSDAEIKTNYINVIPCSYCTSSSSIFNEEWISTVTFNTINNSTGGTAGYNNYTNISTDLIPGNSYSLSVAIGSTGSWTEYCYVFIDWDQDCNLSGSGEVYNLGATTGPGTLSQVITVPLDATPGPTRMRVSLKYSSPPGACENFPYGEVEDYSINVVAGEIELDLKAFLEGTFKVSVMTPNLGDLIPLTQPYNIAPWNYSGPESVAIIPANVVDWVLVELRDAASAVTATSATVVDRQAAFLLTDGSVVSIDGFSNLTFPNSITQQLFVVIRHRNHLGVMSANAITPSGGIYIYDFTIGSSTIHGGANGHKELATGVWGMISGDGNRDDLVGAGDKSGLWDSQAGTEGYIYSDYNLDGQSNNIDKDEYWIPNLGKGSQVPN